LIRVKGKERIPGEPESENELKKLIDAPLSNRENWQPQWPALEEYYVPIGKAKTVVEGDSITVVAYSRMIPLIEELIAAKPELQGRVELIDLRTLYPYDLPAVTSSVQKTGRLLLISEDTEVTNFMDHLYRKVNDECFYYYKARPRVLSGANVPGVGLAETLEEASVPTTHTIAENISAILSEAY